MIGLDKDIVEAEIAHGGRTEHIRAAGAEWLGSDTMADDPREPLEGSVAQRWPSLSAWRWLVSSPAREARLCSELDSSALASAREGLADLAYRGVLPRELGLALDGAGAGCSADTDSEHEEFATSQDQAALEAESLARARRRLRHKHSILVTTALLLGLRKLRAIYAQRRLAWEELHLLARGPPPGGVCNPSLSRPQDVQWEERLLQWATSQRGAGLVQLLRWQLLPFQAALERIRGSFGNLPRSGEARLHAALASIGVPTRRGDIASWGSGLPQ